MKLHILTFGITRDIIGSMTLELEVKEGMCVQDLKTHLVEKYAPMQDLSSLLIAVNNEYSELDQILQAGDEIALIPPVSGG